MGEEKSAAQQRQEEADRRAAAEHAGGAAGMAGGEDAPNSPVDGPVGGESHEDLMSAEEIAAANEELREEDVTAGDRLDDRI